jgi:diadenosine tetraphosphate (Ap4A) HIT family hydrolase
MTPNSIQCDFCNEFSGSSENSFARIYGTRPDTRILFRSSEFAVVPSLGQIVEGYLLILPTKHFRALGDLPDPLVKELASICVSVGRTLNDQYGPYILFEHGTRSEGVGGCGIYHAHLHATPLAGISDPADDLKLNFPCTELAHLSEINERSANLSSYLFYQDSSARLYVFDTGPLPSQYMRKLLCDALGDKDWNWRSAGIEERLRSTIRRLSGPLESSIRKNPRRNYAP